MLGVILGPIAETDLRRALMTEPDWTTFLIRPVSALFLAAAVASVLQSIRRRRRARPPPPATTPERSA